MQHQPVVSFGVTDTSLPAAQNLKLVFLAHFSTLVTSTDCAAISCTIKKKKIFILIISELINQIDFCFDCVDQQHI
jgi:hypothetical protein